MQTNTKPTRSCHELCSAWNEATNPGVMRTDREHHRMRQLARAIRNRLDRHHYSYMLHESGRLIPKAQR